MIELSIEASSVAHGIHYAVLGVGLVGLVVLLGPQLAGARRAPAFDDQHALRVLALTEQISAGQLGVSAAPSPRPATSARSEARDPIRTRYLPIAIVSSAAAAGVHAAVGPDHFRELLAFGLFFATAAIAQLGWSVAMVIRPSRTLLMVAVAGNSAVLLLWLVTRTIGLPGLMPGPEAVGPWDLSCGAWELAVVLAAGRILRADHQLDLRLPAWPEWEASGRAWAIGAALTLPVLGLIGVGS